MKSFLQIIFSILFLLSLSLNTQGQTRAATAHELGLGIGVANYKGEMSAFPNIESPGLGATVFYRANFSQAWSMRIGVVYADVKQSDEGKTDLLSMSRSHEFETSIVEFSARAEYNFFDLSTDRKSPNLWTPYLFAGVGYFLMNSKTNIQPTYELSSFTIPFGVGVKFLLNDKWNINFEFGARKTFTDYIDEIGEEVNVNRGAGARDPRYYTGNPNDNDYYFYTGISIGFFLSPFEHPCPIKVDNY